MYPREDPIFDPWSTGEPDGPESAREPRGAKPAGVAGQLAPADASSHGSGADLPQAARLLRTIGVARLEAIGSRLAAARHVTSVHDLLDEPPRLLRFELTPWPGPLARSAKASPALLEIGLAPDSSELVTAWSWLSGWDGGPESSSSVSRERLTATWIEGVIVTFVGKVLAGG